MSFNPKILELSEWIKLHHNELLVEFDASGRYDCTDPEHGICEDCSGRGEIRDEFDNLEDCSVCEGDGQVVLTERELFYEFCDELYWDQRNVDMKRYHNYMKNIDIDYKLTVCDCSLID